MNIGEIARDSHCGRCGATPGEICVTRSGRRATWLHAARTGPVYAAWGMGYEEGMSDAARDPEWAAKWYDRRTRA